MYNDKHALVVSTTGPFNATTCTNTLASEDASFFQHSLTFNVPSNYINPYHGFIKQYKKIKKQGHIMIFISNRIKGQKKKINHLMINITNGISKLIN